MKPATTQNASLTLSSFLMPFFPAASEPICLRFFPPRGVKGSARKLATTPRALASDTAVQSRVKEFNQTMGVYFVVNSGGDSDADITRYNAFFCEADTRSIAEQHAMLDASPLLPSIRVVTKKSVHAYWLPEGDCSEKEWRDIQARLIHFFAADPANKNPSRVMRLPFLDHIDADGKRQRITIHTFESGRRFTVAQMMSAFPAIEPKQPATTRKATTAGTWATWDALRAELGRRIAAHPTARENKSGKWDCQGICHNGKGASGLFYDPRDNQVHCNQKCEQAAILRAFGLPEAPDLKTKPTTANESSTKEKFDDQPDSEEMKWTAEGYGATPTGMKYRRTRKGENSTGDDVVSLCNFNARILSEVIEDDGAETRSFYEIEATLAGDPVPRKVTIPASEYSPMKWLDDVVGVKGMIFPGKGEHVRCAIKSHSQEAVIKRAIAHTGWRHEGGASAYYTNGGAIGAKGLVAAEVNLPTDFAAYSLPAPPQGTNRIDAVNATLSLLDLASDEITIPTYSATAAAILGGTDYSHHATGISGAHKSCWVALLLNHFGADFRYDHLTGHWQQDTAIALLSKCHIAKDTPLVIDDFKPQKSKQETEKMIQKAEFVLRAQANRAGRGRAMTDGGLRTTKAPRGLVVSTGEDVPPGESLRARLVISEIGQGDIDIIKLTVAQKHARTGVFAQAASSFIQWLATDNLISKRIARRDDDVETWRDYWLAQTSSAHKRHANNLAHITYSWRLWLDFATETDALTKPAAETLWKDRILPALEKCGANQAKWLVSENPADRFIDLLRAALSSGAAHLAYTDGRRPDSDIALACGWREDHPQGARIGFVDEDGIYLIPDSVYEVVSGFGEGVTVSQTILWKRLFEAGKILRDESRETFKFKKTLHGTPVTAVWLKRIFLL